MSEILTPVWYHPVIFLTSTIPEILLQHDPKPDSLVQPRSSEEDIFLTENA